MQESRSTSNQEATASSTAPANPQSAVAPAGNATRLAHVKHVVGIAATVLGLIASALGVWRYVESRPSADLSGEWEITHTIEASSHQPYVGLEIGFRMFVRQNGKEVVADGEKWKKHGEPIPTNRRSPLLVEGVIDGDAVTATFEEEGAPRKTHGNIRWKIEDDGHRLVGTFVSTAADVRGRSVGVRLEPRRGE